MSYRLGGIDGVAVESAKWQAAFRRLGWEVHTVAGEGAADFEIAGLGLSPASAPDAQALRDALAGADLVVAENVLSIPLNPSAAQLVAHVLEGRPSLLRHHDLPWQHPRWELAGWQVPNDRDWAHVVLSELSRGDLAARGIEATVIRNAFAGPGPADRDATRQWLGVSPEERLFLHPGRAIWRKNVGEGLALATALEATYWLTGAVEQEYGSELDRLVAGSGRRFIHRAVDNIDDAYAACDAVVFPSTWEGFGNPPIEGSLRERPVAVGAYPVGRELMARFGFRWFATADPSGLGAWLDAPDASLLDHNRRVASAHFDLRDLDTHLRRVLRRWGW